MNAVRTWTSDVAAIKEALFTHAVAYDADNVAVAYLSPRERSYPYKGDVAHLIYYVFDPLLTVTEIVETKVVGAKTKDNVRRMHAVDVIFKVSSLGPMVGSAAIPHHGV